MGALELDKETPRPQCPALGPVPTHHTHHFICAIPVTFSTTFPCHLCHLSFPLFPSTDKKTLSDPKSHRKFHFMAIFFPLGFSMAGFFRVSGAGQREFQVPPHQTLGCRKALEHPLSLPLEEKKASLSEEGLPRDPARV